MSSPTPEPFLRAGAEITVDFFSSFLTGITLDAARIVTTGYDAAQRAVLAALKETMPQQWEPLRSVDAGGLRYTIDDQAGSAVIPLTFVDRTDASVTEAIAGVQSDRLGVDSSTAVGGANGTRWTLENASLRIYDFGVGNVSLRYSVSLSESQDVDALQDTVEAMSTEIPQLINPILPYTVASFRSAAAHLEDATAREERQRAADTPLASGPAAEALWVHNVYYIPTEAKESVKTASERARCLCPSFYAEVELDGYNVLPGIFSSVAVFAPKHRADASALTRVLRLQDGWLAAIMELDRTLFFLMHESAYEARETASPELERRSRVIAASYNRVRLMRSTLSTILGNWADRDVGIWQAASGVWRFDESLRGVDDKLDSLQTLYENVMTRLSARRERRLNTTVLVFAAFSVVAAFAEAGNYIAGGGVMRAYLIGGVGVVALAVVAVLLVVSRRV